MSSTTCRVILVDDHTMFREGIKRVILSRKDCEVVGEAADGLQLLELLRRVEPDVIVLDISMPNLGGLETIFEIRRTHPRARILILSMHKSAAYLQRAFAAGADGYTLKEDAVTELFSAIDTVRKGGKYVSPSLSEQLTSFLIHESDSKASTVAEKSLTPRERQILKLVAEGKANKEIAEVLCISTRTVERHRASVMKKLGLKNTAELVRFAVREGYTTPAP